MNRALSAIRATALLLSILLCLSCAGLTAFAADVGGNTPYVGSSSDNGDGTFDNDAAVDSDVPDPEIIRVGDAYYMTSTSMHFCPGVPIMKSYDLVNWEVVNYVYNVFADYDQLAFRDGKYDYGKGSWATSMSYREYDKKFYVSHTCNTTNKTYFYRTDDLENGTFEQIVCNKFYHDASMLFVGEDAYMFYGSGTIYVDKLKPDFSGSEWSKTIITADMTTDVCGARNTFLEATHAYKIGNTFYVFMCTWPSGRGKMQLVFKSDVIDSNYTGKVIIDDSYGRSEGLAQGGVVDMVDGSTQTTGKWMGFFMHLRGAAGRGLVLTPCSFDSNGWPVVANSSGKVTRSDRVTIPVEGNFEKKSIVVSTDFNNGDTRPAYTYQTIPANPNGDAAAYAYYGSNLPLSFEWNHMPDNRLWSLTERDGYLRLTNGYLATSVTDCKNVLTTRTYGPECTGHIAMEIDGMKDGDVAGLAAFHRSYGYCGVKMENGKKYIIYRQRNGNSQDESFSNNDPWIEDVLEELDDSVSRVYFKVYNDYRTYRNEYAHFYYSVDGESWVDPGKSRLVEFGYPTHFDGARFGIFNFATRQLGGYVDVDYFELGDSAPKEVEDFRERLTSLVKKADSLLAEEYSQATWSPLATALAAAKTVLANENAAEEVLEAAWTDLRAAYTALEVSPRKTLRELVEKAVALAEADYTPETWQPMAQELAFAKALLERSNATENDLSGACKRLTDRIETLEYKGAPVTDYFADGTLGEQWQVEREDKETYGIEAGKGLVMPTQRYDIYGDGHDAWKNLFLMPAMGNWQAVAKVVYPRVPVENYQQAMMLVWQDEDNYIRMNCQQSNLKLEPGVETGGSFSGSGFNQPNASSNADGTVTLYFMFEKIGDDYSVGYSQDGKSFTVLGTAKGVHYEKPYIGLIATANTDDGFANPIDTYVEYVYVTRPGGLDEEGCKNMLQWAAEQAADYVAAAIPNATDQDLPALPAVPHGYKAELISSEPSVISADGKLTQADEAKEVLLSVKVAEGDVEAFVSKTVDVPGKGEPVLDKSELRTAIENAKALDLREYTDASAGALRVAIDAATQALSEAKTEEELTQAIAALEKAISELEKPSYEFADVKDESKFYYVPVYWAVNHDPQITNGATETTFAPEKACTRGHVVTFLWRTAGEPAPTSSNNPFTDLKDGAFYYTAVLWAVEKGITTGASKTTFAPGKPCTRGQIVTFLWRFKNSPEPTSTENPFADVKADAFYYKAVLWAVENNVTSGTGKGKFSPDSTCTRGQVVTFLYRAAGEE